MRIIYSKVIFIFFIFFFLFTSLSTASDYLLWATSQCGMTKSDVEQKFSSTLVSIPKNDMEENDIVFPFYIPEYSIGQIKFNVRFLFGVERGKLIGVKLNSISKINIQNKFE